MGTGPEYCTAFILFTSGVMQLHGQQGELGRMVYTVPGSVGCHATKGGHWKIGRGIESTARSELLAELQ